MEEFEVSLRQLVVETCQQKIGSLDRQRGLTRIVRSIAKSGKLWKENTLDYEDALQQTWLYFCRNLCEATTGDRYDPSRSSVTTWLNAYLRRRLQDLYLQRKTTNNSTTRQVYSVDELGKDAIEALEAPPDVPPILETTRKWIQIDPDGDLRRTYIQGYPKVNCQVLLLQRLPPETSWEDLAAQYKLSVSTLSSFYRRQCLPRLRKFGESQGYLEDTYHELSSTSKRSFPSVTNYSSRK
ncbi:MAG: hypothetical protein N4J56_001208 [Chroococcidiopsis sp. SAG 2025]|uniref:sigma-70 family RNA polymerase sigma factor n=1 Tax=Chroococcidiopsis sp. SAG 2025 TaxID=171389 RepID=UPI002936DF4C|nr:sigma-70 family RNA polymerase sigma factor [Chroococcidiopsis sp. SAG 2025]MDV2991554.1 hypothetical protein [Chroococcidiopsis sp. SAG 2025]